jgi:hypothetical protein
VAGAVKAGAAAESGPGAPIAGTPQSPGLEPRARAEEPEETVERLRVLLAQSEEAMAEMRRLLADATR